MPIKVGDNHSPWEQNREHINASIKAAILKTIAKSEDARSYMFDDETIEMVSMICDSLERGDIPNVRIEY